MIALVAGSDRVDAGKTTFSVGLLERTGGVGFKPRAGNDYWFDHDDCRRALADGRLYGKDVNRLASAGGSGRPIEALNPVHRLWKPTPDGGQGLLGRNDREFVVDRVGDDFVVNATAEVPDRVARSLPLEGALRVETVEELNEVSERRYAPAFDALAEEVSAPDLAVVESYGDVARPLGGLVPDVVAVVEPMRASVYRGDRFDRACEVARSSPQDGLLEKRVSDVVAYLEPLDRVALPPLERDARTDPARIASAYGPAYEAVLSAATGVK